MRIQDRTAYLLAFIALAGGTMLSARSIVTNANKKDLKAAEATCERGNIMRAYLRYRVERLQNSDRAVQRAAVLFPILNCSLSKYGKEVELNVLETEAYIRTVIDYAK